MLSETTGSAVALNEVKGLDLASSFAALRTARAASASFALLARVGMTEGRRCY
jgi:hypothetical protein